MRAAALSAPIEAGEEDDLEDDGEEEREVSSPHLEAVFMICFRFLHISNQNDLWHVYVISMVLLFLKGEILFIFQIKISL